MPEVIFPGPEGRLEGRYHPQIKKDSPLAIVLHPHPKFGGTMNNKVVYNLHYAFHRMGFTVLRFNFPGSRPFPGRLRRRHRRNSRMRHPRSTICRH